MKAPLHVWLLGLILASGLAMADQHEANDQADEDGQDLIEVLRSNPEFSTFADALERTGMAGRLEQEGPYTILAPTNDAFERAGLDLESLNDQQLMALVSNHLISGMVSPDELGTLASIRTLLGTQYPVAPGAGESTGAVAGQADAPTAPATDSDEDEADPGEEDAPGVPDDPDQPAQPGDAPDAGTADPEEAEGEVPAAPEGESAEGEADPGEEDAPGVPDDPDQPAQPGDEPAGDATTPAGAGDGEATAPGAAGAAGPTVGEAGVVDSGLETFAGVIYQIDTVLVPESLAEQGADDPAATPETDAEAEGDGADAGESEGDESETDGEDTSD